MIAAISDRTTSARDCAEPGGLLHKPPPERVADRAKHRVRRGLEARECLCQPGIDEELVVTDHEEPHFAHEQRHEPERSPRASGLASTARNHPRLQEALYQHGTEARKWMVLAHFRRQLHDNGELARREVPNPASASAE